MTGEGETARSGRPPLPRDSFRGQRSAAPAAVPPVIVTPDYGDDQTGAAGTPPVADVASTRVQAPARRRSANSTAARNPFDAYGERTSSRPYALRLPDAIDLVLRQMAAESRTHPLRVIDRILYDHLKKTGRLPPVDT